MKKDVLFTGTIDSGKESYGNHRGIHPIRIDEIIAKIKFKRTIRRLIKMIKSK